jgi:hypothetical protein
VYPGSDGLPENAGAAPSQAGWEDWTLLSELPTVQRGCMAANCTSVITSSAQRGKEWKEKLCFPLTYRNVSEHPLCAQSETHYTVIPT